ncbi:hypothetical protein D918_05862 [Trichuris suis]|nr:hypothetical protein D918_05862 [Trichuris suis]
MLGPTTGYMWRLFTRKANGIFRPCPQVYRLADVFVLPPEKEIRPSGRLVRSGPVAGTLCAAPPCVFLALLSPFGLLVEAAERAAL